MDGDEEGTPQGATISPLLANVYLHYVFDLWVQQWRTPARARRHDRRALRGRFRGRASSTWTTPDGSSRAARAVREVRAGAAPRQDATVRFGRFAAGASGARKGKPETFDFLGFTHICGRTRSGKFLARRGTIAKRMRAKLQW